MLTFNVFLFSSFSENGNTVVSDNLPTKHDCRGGGRKGWEEGREVSNMEQGYVVSHELFLILYTNYVLHSSSNEILRK